MKNILIFIKNLACTVVFILISCWNANAVNYYSKAIGNLNTPATWGTATDGTGAAPANFTTAGNVFFIRNNATPTISANWTVSGAGSKIVAGDGTNPSNFAVSGALVLTATIDISANATLTLITSGTLNGIVLGALSNTSTVNYAGGNQTIRNYNYGNLRISGTGTKSWNIGGSNKRIAGNLNNNSSVVLTLSGNRTLTVTGITDISGTVNLTTNQNRLFTGDLTLNTGAVWNESLAQPITFEGNFINNAATFTASTGVHTFLSAEKTIGGATASVIPTVVINGSRNITSGSTLTVNTALSGPGTLRNGGILNSGGTLSTTTLVNSGAMTKSGVGTMTTVLPNFTNIGTLNLTGSGAITGITNNAGGIVNLVNSGTITSFNNATATSTLNISDLTIAIITTLTSTVAGNTVNYNGAGAQIVKSNTYGNIGISGTGIKTVPGNLIVNNNFTLASGTFVLNNATSFTLTVGGNYLQTGGLFDFNAGTTGTSIMNLAGNLTNTVATLGSINTVGAGAPNGKVLFNGSAIQIVNFSNPAASEWVTYEVNATSTLKLASDITVLGDVSAPTLFADFIINGTIDLGTFTLRDVASAANGSHFVLNNGANLITANTNGIALFGTNTGSVQFNGNRTYNTGGNFTFNAAGNQAIGNGLTAANNVTLSGAGTKSFSAVSSTTANLTIASGVSANLGIFTHTAGNLILGGFNKTNGTWGSTSSLPAATNQDNVFFAGSTGVVTVTNDTRPTAIFSSLSANASICSGTATTALSGVLSNGGIYATAGTTVAVTINSVTQNTTITGSVGAFTIVFNTSTIPVSGIPYTITYAYAGDGNLQPAATNTSTALTVNPFTWSGTVDSSWTNINNWSCGAIPTAATAVVISSATNYPVIASTVAINSLTIDSGATLTVNSGNNLTVANAIANAGTLTIKSNANLIQINNVANTGAGVTNVERESSPVFRLDYTLWSSPVSGTQTVGGFSPLTSTNRFYEYNTNTNLYNGVPSTTPFSLAKGYLIRMPNTWVDFVPFPGAPATPASWTGVFAGTPNNGDITIGSLTPGQFYAVGNPYPSTIDADLFLNGSPTDGTLYFWRKTNAAAGTAYATYTLAGGAGTFAGTSGGIPNGTIQVGQGFVVKTDVGIGTDIFFTNLMRVPDNTNQFFRTKKTERNRIWLNLSKDAKPVNQMLLAYMTGATQGIDKAIDGRYINDNQTALNSFVNNEEFAIQGRALPFDGTDIVPLAFKTTTDGNYTIAIDHVDGLFSGSQDIYLVDNKTGTETNLKTSSYPFTADLGVDNTRFSLKFQKTLKVIPASFNDNSVTVYRNNGVIYVNSGAKMMNSVAVFDIQGRLLTEQKSVKANTTSIPNLKASNQVLIVQVTNEDNQVISKKVEN